MKNSTEIQTNNSSYTNISLNHTQYHSNISYYPIIHDMSGTLGYGVGRVLREAFDYAYDAWQGWWYPRPSVETITQHRQAAIYRQGLEVVVTQLDAAIENLRKNPCDPASLERVKRTINDKDYANYFKPAQTEKLRGFQAHLFKPIHEKVQRFKVPRLKKIVQEYLSVLQTEIKSLAIDSTLPIPTGTLSGTEIKRSIVQQPAVVPVPASLPTAILSTSFQTPFGLTTLNGNNGFAIEGLNIGDLLGISVGAAGDVNGDGKADFILVADSASPGGRKYAGTVYVLFGQANGWPAQFNLTTLNGSNGFAIEGLNTNDYLGFSVSTAGDVNDDGKADLVLGAHNSSPGGRTFAGTVYVLFGKQSGWLPQFNLMTLNGINGFVVEGINAADYLGWSVSTAGDVNDDGKADLVLGAWGTSPGGRNQAGAAYVLFGRGSGWSAQFNLKTLNGTNGFAIEGLNAGDSLGWSVSTAGDVNGDGKADLVLGAPTAPPGRRSQAGTTYVLFGQANGWSPRFSLATLNGTNGFAVEGINTGDKLGSSVSTAGDINNDGKTDLVLGSQNASPGGRASAGTVYVLFGRASGWSPQFNLTTLDGKNGLIVEGLNALDSLGYSVDTAGDVNGDGFADLVLGANEASPGGRREAGTAYVLFGRASGWSPQFSLTTLDGSNGFIVEGLNALDKLGHSVGTAGDVNGDGKADLLLGAVAASPGGRINAGTAYVIFGKNTTIPSPLPSLIAIPFIIAGSIVGGLVVLGGLGCAYKRSLSKNNTRDDQDGGLSPPQPSINREDAPLLAEKNTLLLLPLKKTTSLSAVQPISWHDLTVGRRIGGGGYGEVYQGEWSGIPVAIKKLHLKTLSTSLSTDFEREANIMAQCQFPYIIRLYGVCLEVGHAAMVMEYMTKGSLYQVLHDEKEALPWNSIRWKIAIDVGKGLSYLHGQKIIHRDLKSLNVLLDDQYHAKISDFGLSKIKLETDSINTKTTQGMGTTRWCAPELFSMKDKAPSPNQATDVYSYGMVLWEIASRMLPFQGALDDMMAGLWIMQGKKEKFPQDCPKAYKILALQCWDIPKKRPSAQVITAALSQAKPLEILELESKRYMKKNPGTLILKPKRRRLLKIKCMS